jgi:hypothetical protein
MAKQKIRSTTQDFTEIADILGDVVFFKDKSAVAILEVSSVNFFLLSNDEQNARVYGYMSLLNSLSFPIQIFIVSRRIDLGSYIKTLDDRIASVQSQKIKEHLAQYKEFIKVLIQGEGLLDKKLFVVVPFTSLELGVISNVSGAKDAIFTEQAKSALYSKRNNIISQIERMGLSARALSNDELAKLFYELFNQDFVSFDFNSTDIKNVII